MAAVVMTCALFNFLQTQRLIGMMIAQQLLGMESKRGQCSTVTLFESEQGVKCSNYLGSFPAPIHEYRL